MGFFPFFPLPVSGALITPPVNLSGAFSATPALSVTDTTATPTVPPTQYVAAAAADLVIGIEVAADTNERFTCDSNGRMSWGPGNAALDTVMSRSAVGQLTLPGFRTNGNADVVNAGSGLRVAEGSNAKQGTFVLSGAATTVVANTSITASSRIILTCQALGTVASASTLAVSSRSVGVSFTVTPSQATDTSTIAFQIFEPG